MQAELIMPNLKVGILGSGTMGRQLALLCAAREKSVLLWNHRRQDDFDKDFKRLANMQSRLGTIPKEEIDVIVTRVVPVDDLTKFSSCDLIIESVKENLAIKSDVLSQIKDIAPSNALIATNTSTLSITELASMTAYPANFVGLHFFNPPMTMKLVEVVRGELTSDDTIETAIKFLTILGKQPVVLPETPGFVVNRLLFPMINEAIFLLSEGIADEKIIDSCMQFGANHPMGPLELADFIGLDVCLSILETLVAETGDAKYRPAHLLKKYVRAGKLGRKTGIGFYNYRKRG